MGAPRFAIAHDELSRLEWEIQREQARFGATSPGEAESDELEEQEDLTLSELLLGGALVGLILAAIIGVVVVLVGLLSAAVGKLRRDRRSRR